MLSDRVFQAILLIQVFSETYQILIVSSPLELQVYATDSLKFGSSRSDFLDRLRLDAGLILSQLRPIIFGFSVYGKPLVITYTHIGKILVALIQHDVSGSKTVKLQLFQLANLLFDLDVFLLFLTSILNTLNQGDLPSFHL